MPRLVEKVTRPATERVISMRRSSRLSMASSRRSSANAAATGSAAGAGRLREAGRNVAPALGAPLAPRPVEDFVGIRDPFGGDPKIGEIDFYLKPVAQIKIGSHSISVTAAKIFAKRRLLGTSCRRLGPWLPTRRSRGTPRDRVATARE